MDEILITNTHANGFAFALKSDTREQVFIPPYAVNGIELERGSTYMAMLIENPNKNQQHRTPFMCINIAVEDSVEDSVKDSVEDASWDPFEDAVEDAPAPDVAELPTTVSGRDDIIYNLICDGLYTTTAELAEASGLDVKTAGNSANRLFNGGRISKAEVYHRVGQQRCSFTLWAQTASSFLEY